MLPTAVPSGLQCSKCTGSCARASRLTFTRHSRRNLALAFLLQGPWCSTLLDAETWSNDDQYMFGDALMFPPAGICNPQSNNRRVYFPKTATCWHSWFNTSNGTVYSPGTWADVPTPIMTAPLMVKGAKPVFFQEPGMGGDTIGIRVWQPVTPIECTAEASRALQWSGLYNDDGESTEYLTAGVHWRGAAGFASCSDGQLLLRFQVLHSSYATLEEQVVWTLQRVDRKPLKVACSAGNVALGTTEWSHSLEDSELRVSVKSASSHECVVSM